MPALVPSAACARWNRCARSAFVELQCPGESVEDRRGDSSECAAFELGVVLDTPRLPMRRPRCGADRGPGAGRLGQARLVRVTFARREVRNSRNLGSVIHVFDGTTRTAARDAL